MRRIQIMASDAACERLDREAEARGIPVSELGRYLVTLNVDAQLEEVDRVRALFSVGPFMRSASIDAALQGKPKRGRPKREKGGES